MRVILFLIILFAGMSCQGAAEVEQGSHPALSSHVIRVLYTPDGGEGALAVARIQAVLAFHHLTVPVQGEEVDRNAPAPFGYKGSPTILLDGVDLEPSARRISATGHGGREYPDANPQSPGVPSEKMIQQAFLELGWFSQGAFWPAVIGTLPLPSGSGIPNRCSALIVVTTNLVLLLTWSKSPHSIQGNN